MSDSTGTPGDGAKADKPSLQKTSVANNKTSAARKQTAPGGKVDMARPVTVVALTALMMLSGLFAVIAALLLYGHEGQIADNVRDNTPPISAAQASNAGDKVASAVSTSLTGSTANAATAQKARDAADKVLDDKDVLPTKSISNDDRSDQKDKAHTAITAQLKGKSGTLSATQVSAISDSLSSTVQKNLTTLRASQAEDITKRADSTPRSLLISGIVLLVALGLVGMGAYAGRFWARWAVPVIWVLSSFTGTTAGFYSLIQLNSGLPTGFKVGAAVSAILLIGAVVLTFLRPSRQWFDAHRPVMPEGTPQRRGLFMPRVPPPTGTSRTRLTPPAGKPGDASADKADADTTPAKSRTATSESAPAGARSRPRQASKSRRTPES